MTSFQSCTLYVMRGEEKYIQDFGGETWGTDHLEDPDEDWILIKWKIKRNTIQRTKVASIHLSQIRDTLRAAVTTVFHTIQFLHSLKRTNSFSRRHLPQRLRLLYGAGNRMFCVEQFDDSEQWTAKNVTRRSVAQSQATYREIKGRSPAMPCR